VLGGLLRDIAPDPEEIWRFSPFPDLSIIRFFKESRNYRTTAFHLLFCAGILFAEFLRQTLDKYVFWLPSHWKSSTGVAQALMYATTLFAVTIPLKIWNNTRNEKKLEEQARLLAEARLAALTSQINPHFLFNTLNSVSSLIRTDPNQARVMVVKLSKVLRRLLRKHETFSALREELNFIEDYLSIEVVRFGEKLRFEKDVAEDTLDMLVPSMLLQPLVENSIKHGLSSKIEGGSIYLRSRMSDSHLIVEVEDDGVGMGAANLLERPSGLGGTGIGMANVAERLKVLYGDNARMTIDSREGKGTLIRLRLPLLPGEEDIAAALYEERSSTRR